MAKKKTLDEIAQDYIDSDGDPQVIENSDYTAEEVIEFVRARKGVPVLAMVLINKRADNKIDDVPLRALIRARPVRT